MSVMRVPLAPAQTLEPPVFAPRLWFCPQMPRSLASKGYPITLMFPLFPYPRPPPGPASPGWVSWEPRTPSWRRHQGNQERMSNTLKTVTASLIPRLLSSSDPCLSVWRTHPLGGDCERSGRYPMDVLDHSGQPFPQSLPEFQRLFPDDRACAAYLERFVSGAPITGGRRRGKPTA
jgi:hypothetical protein